MTWQENLNAKLDEREARQQAPRKNAHITYPQTHDAFLKEAAAKRGMRLGTYARAALYAFAAHDLGVDVDDMLTFLPDYGKDAGQLRGRPLEKRTDTKPTSGQWSIGKLGGKHHGLADD